MNTIFFKLDEGALAPALPVAYRQLLAFKQSLGDWWCSDCQEYHGADEKCPKSGGGVD